MGLLAIRTHERSERALPGDYKNRTMYTWATALALTTLMVALAAALFSMAAPPKYVSTVNILVGPVTSDVDTLRAAESLTSTYSQVLVSAEAVQNAADSVGMSAKEVADDAVVTFNNETRIVTLTVTTSTSSASRGIASSLTRQLTTLVGTVDPTSPGALSILSVQPQTAERAPRSILRYAVLGGAAWLLLAVGVLAALASRPGGVGRFTAFRSPAAPPAAALSRSDVDSIAEQVKRKVLDSLDDRDSLRR